MVWPNLPIPTPSLVCDFVSYEKHVLESETIKKTIESKSLTQNIQVILPRRLTTSANRGKGDLADSLHTYIKEHCPILWSVLKGNQETLQHGELNYCSVSNVPLHLLFHKVFIDHYVKKGHVYAISVDTDIQSDDSLMITPSGCLKLSLTEKSYHRLGMEGKPSLLNRKKNVITKFNVEIDLGSDLASKSESKYYTRTFNCLRNSGLKFNLLIKWEPSKEVNPNVSSESINQYFIFMKNNPGPGGAYMLLEDANQMIISSCPPSLRNHSVPVSLLPSQFIDLDHPVEEEDRITYVQDLIDWCGAHLSSVSCSLQSTDLDVTDFGFARENSVPLASVSCSQVNGVFTPTIVTHIIDEVMALVNAADQTSLSERSGQLDVTLFPFIVITANGFPNGVLSWSGKNNEHGKQLTGENMYSILMSLHDRKSIIWRIADGYDFSVEKL
ncbi:Ribonuclease P protein subunit p40 [Halotydeus destructor]|nr:Ribonuclease P protein subunit p40 [Halotydeus destructor]